MLGPEDESAEPHLEVVVSTFPDAFNEPEDVERIVRAAEAGDAWAEAALESLHPSA